MKPEHDPTDLKRDERAQRQNDQAATLLRDQEKSDFRWLMNDEKGRRFVWRLLTMTGVFRTSFTGNSETFFREGERNIGLKVISEVHELTPELYAKMTRESKRK